MDTEEDLKSLNEPQVLPSKLKRFSVRFFELIVTLTESSSYTAVLNRVPFFSASSILESYASIMMYFSDLFTNPGLGSSLITGLPVFNIIMETRNNRMSAIKQLIIFFQTNSHILNRTDPAYRYYSTSYPKITIIILLAKNSLQSYNKKNERRRSRVDPHTNHIINNTKTNNQ